MAARAARSSCLVVHPDQKASMARKQFGLRIQFPASAELCLNDKLQMTKHLQSQSAGRAQGSQRRRGLETETLWLWKSQSHPASLLVFKYHRMVWVRRDLRDHLVPFSFACFFPKSPVKIIPGALGAKAKLCSSTQSLQCCSGVLETQMDKARRV